METFLQQRHSVNQRFGVVHAFLSFLLNVLLNSLDVLANLKLHALIKLLHGLVSIHFRLILLWRREPVELHVVVCKFREHEFWLLQTQLHVLLDLFKHT